MYIIYNNEKQLKCLANCIQIVSTEDLINF